MKPDKEQEEASKYISGHSLIIAGAGTGKTTTLLYKIDYLLNHGVSEKEILVISFTNETVNNFKSKCKHNIDVYTFHKLANKIILNKKDVVGQELLEDCIKEYFDKIPEKLKKKVYHMLYYKIYTKKRYSKDINTFYTDSITSFFYQTINQIKANNINMDLIDIKMFSKNEHILIYCLKMILNYYKITLNKNYLIDFDGLIIEATKNINNKLFKSNYKHILVDEYQDISKIRLEFLQSLIKNNDSILTAVGDDFQSIYGFNGSNIQLFYNFQSSFLNGKIFYIQTTYRCPQKIINKAGKFIMKNPYQIKKNLVSKNKINGKIKKIFTSNYKKKLIKLIKKYKKTKLNVLILSRDSFDINFFINKKNKVENSYIVFKNRTLKNIRYLTIHKSKGLEADIVIILNLSENYNGFPREQGNELINKILKNNENYEYAEERRLFYVALTRCRIKTYLIIDRKYPSRFISEI